MERFTVNQLAKLADVSVRTLHYYDEIGLLKPAVRTDAGYRYYGKEELLKLQQILFYRELDIPLTGIQNILDDDAFNTMNALEEHKKEIQARIKRFKTLLHTIDHTIANIKNEKMNYEEMYKGFTPDQVTAYENEVKEKWGSDKLEESKPNINSMSKADLNALKLEAEVINEAMVKLMDKNPADSAVQQLIARHYEMINKFYECPLDMYHGFGNMYVNDERFRVNFDKHATGLAAFMKRAMDIYYDNNK